MEEKRVKFACGQIPLEGFIAVAQKKPALVICHPHPLYGGSMDSSVVIALRDAAWGIGMGTLRFNFRGTGGSGGRHSGGVREIEDAESAVEFMRKSGAVPGNVCLAGYSFGAGISLRLAAKDKRIKKVVAVAPPAHYDYAYLKHNKTPKLMILGQYDNVASPQDIEKIMKDFDNTKIKVIKGADHFFYGELDDIKKYTEEFLKSKTLYKDYCGK